MQILTQFVLFGVVCIVSVFAEEDFNKLISKADIFYINPDSNSKIPLTRLKEVQHYNSTGVIKFLIHGLMASKDHPSIAPIRNAYLSTGLDSLFIADWSEAANVIYFQSRYFVKPVGLRFAKMFEVFFKNFNLEATNVHILGHSLGAHIAGNIGRFFNGSIGRITGLDPALPLFTKQSRDDLRPDTAKFVDVIHTDSQVLGDFTPRGHADFYPNNGYVPQPGCATLDIVTFTACSHFRAPLFYAETIITKDKFPSVKCPLKTLRLEQGKRCLSNPTSGSLVLMGEGLRRDVRGSYFLETNNVPPYGLGQFTKGPWDRRI